jgi:Mn2+/Fe2+ NRAMP family transporter
MANRRRLIWKIVFLVSIVFFALCSFLVYALRTELRPFDQSLAGIALAIAIFSVQTLQGIDDSEDLKTLQKLESYEFQKRLQRLAEQVERKCGPCC